MSSANDVRQQIESSIEKARKQATERVAAIDARIRGDFARLRGDFDVNRFASENAPQLVAAGVATGIVLGYALPKPLLRILQVATAVGVATAVAKAISERAACESDAE